MSNIVDDMRHARPTIISSTPRYIALKFRLIFRFWNMIYGEYQKEVQAALLASPDAV